MECLEYEGVIIGAGAVGLATGYALGDLSNILILDRNERSGQEISSRSSEVIHAGFYYPSNSLKEQLCMEGRDRLYQFLTQHRLPFKKVGKLVIARTTGETEKVNQLYGRALTLGIPVHELSGFEIQKLEPKIRAIEGFFSPCTGIFDSEQYIRSLEMYCTDRGVTFAFHSTVQGWEYAKSRYHLHVDQQNHKFSISCRWVINAAGLSAFRIGCPTFPSIPPLEVKYVRGHYFRLSAAKRHAVSRLIYPVPDQGGGLGIHITMSLDGELRLGPDTDWSHHTTPRFEFFEEELPNRRRHFFQEVKSYFPSLLEDELQPGYIGVRPKPVLPGTRNTGDFYVEEESKNGFPGWINLLGIESPGLTASLAIGNHVARKLQDFVRD